MSAVKKSGILAVVIFSCLTLNAQFWEYGVDPQSLRWQQINTEHYKLIFPSDFRLKANYLANTLEKYYPPNSASLNHSPSKIPVIIHNQTVHSNAFVAPAPRRMEFFTYPDPKLYGIDWLTELSIHEFRHAIQLDKLKQGTTRILTYLIGEQGIGLSAAMLPFWFLEGDAVTAETQLTGTGRGRLPAFEMDLKTHLLTRDKHYSFSKSYLGSYRDHVPDYYTYGYQMVNYATMMYGDNYWSKAIDFVANRPYLISPLHFYSRSVTGGGNRQLYVNTMDYLKKHWSKAYSERKIDSSESLNTRKNNIYSSYHSPEFLDNSKIVAVKTGLSIIPRFVRLDNNGREKKIFTPGSLISGDISVRNSRILWDELAVDPRWSNRSYSILKELDTNTGKKRKITSRTRYSSPEYSVSGDTIAAVEVTPEYEFFLVLLSSGGEVLKRIHSPGNVHLQDPAWISTACSTAVCVITADNSGKKIMSYDLSTNVWSLIYNASFSNISGLKTRSGFLYFNGAFNGIDNLYRFDVKTKNLSRLSNSPFGAFDPGISKDNSTIVFSDYSEKGFNLISNKIDPEPAVIPYKNTEMAFISQSDSRILNIPENDSITYPVEKYSKLRNMFKFHSWSPFYFDYNDPQIDDPHLSPGITLLSQNLLGTAITSLGWEYSHETSFFHLNYTYKGLYPVFEVSSTYGGRPFLAERDSTILPSLGTNMYYTFLTYIPLSFNTGKYYTGIRPSLRLTNNSSYYYYESIQDYKRGITLLQPELYFYSYLRTSQRDIQPRTGLTLNLRNVIAPFENELFGSVTSLHSTVYIPGILRNHGLRLRAELQSQKTKSYLYHNIINPPRGYAFIPAVPDMKKFSIDYVLPLLYPDLSIGPVLYLKRIRASLFGDLVQTSFRHKNLYTEKNYISEGIEVYADYHLFRIILEISSGLRISYLPNEGTLNTRFLLTINLDKY